MLLAIALAKGPAMPTSELEVSTGEAKRDSLQLAVQLISGRTIFRLDLLIIRCN
jgi:hypothetical protein